MAQTFGFVRFVYNSILR
ncbi:MAG: helix-turn-helix domain-containing protein [Citrobacter freundii]|nr:helix-turn-helix domain-containing protein [Citrobacter freundii]